jgi:hypothetical protein
MLRTFAHPEDSEYFVGDAAWHGVEAVLPSRHEAQRRI